MKLRFTKMHGAGNDFVVFDGVRQKIDLTALQWRQIADRHFGIGADQILLVEKPSDATVDFNYRIFNADGGEVEHCGNGARCFVRFVNEQGLSDKTEIKVRTMNGDLTLKRITESTVQVNMGQPIFAANAIPYEPNGVATQLVGGMMTTDLVLADSSRVHMAVLSMGNPHAVILVPDTHTAPVELVGTEVRQHRNFPNQVNVGFMHIVSRSKANIRVFERGVGETIACGTGVCAAVVSGIKRGLLETEVDVTTRGGIIRVQWDGSGNVLMTGPTQTVFSGEVDLSQLNNPSLQQ